MEGLRQVALTPIIAASTSLVSTTVVITSLEPCASTEARSTGVVPVDA
jgi:hypothetical protein